MGLVALFAAAPLACGSLLGIDSGTARQKDASSVVDVAADVFSADGFEIDDGAPIGDAPIGDGGFIADTFVPLDAGPSCTPDLNWCETHCGTGADNCGQMRGCASDCPTGQTCIGNVCTCEASTGWCNGRCQNTTNNCGTPVDCGNCDGGLMCYSNACGCMPDPAATTCAGKQCGSAVNNCNLTVNCGVNSTTGCSSGQYCKPDDTCCTPDNSICNGRCQTTLTNNCGQALPCPGTCPNNGVCLGTSCCTPTGCGGSCVDNCGQQNSSCCPMPPPDAGCKPTGCGGPCIDNCGQQNSSCCPPPDSGGPPPDAGGCGGLGAPCSSNCCSGLCGYNFTCVTSCGQSGAPCSSPSDCCYGKNCSGVATPTAAAPSASPLDGGISLGTCQP